MREIPLTRGQVALVDDEDYERLACFKWFAFRTASTNRYYAARGIRYRKPDGRVSVRLVFMHNQIMGPESEKEVDHANRDSLDNQRSNLRFATRAQNQANVTSRRMSRSGFRGVYPMRNGRFYAMVRRGGRLVHLGVFADAIEAARAWNDAARKTYGEFAVLNPI